MANGEEDLREKNRDRIMPEGKHYERWKRSYGREDAEMLEEKTSAWKSDIRARRRRFLDED